MSMEVIQAIHIEEDRAEQINLNAQEEAKKILQDAQAMSVSLLEQTVTDAEQNAREVIKNAEWKAQNEVINLDKQVEKECEGILEKGNQKLKKAVEMILGRVVNVHGNR